MSESIPQNLEPRLEREPISYERVLEAARGLKAEGIRDYHSESIPHAVYVQDLLDDWKSDADLIEVGIETADKARNIVRCARIWIDAGFSGLKPSRDAMEYLSDEYAMALNRGDSVEVLGILKSALESLERSLGQKNPSEKMPAKLAAKMREAEEFVGAGRITDAVGVLTLALFDPRFKRISPQILEGVRHVRDSYKALG